MRTADPSANTTRMKRRMAKTRMATLTPTPTRHPGLRTERLRTPWTSTLAGPTLNPGMSRGMRTTPRWTKRRLRRSRLRSSRLARSRRTTTTSPIPIPTPRTAWTTRPCSASTSSSAGRSSPSARISTARRTSCGPPGTLSSACSPSSSCTPSASPRRRTSPARRCPSWAPCRMPWSPVRPSPPPSPSASAACSQSRCATPRTSRPARVPSPSTRSRSPAS
mmetsp:Transcript_3188/g.14361  ORF Transcript_3188/g.14361 Transcript_3188/m.14361 type:complete len:221 (-) Transcript_3188:901-1563(-)